MKGTLIKRGKGDYKLFVNDTPFGQSKQSPYNKLSLKNCQAIENGYDLEDLAYDFSWNYQSDPNYGDTTNIFKAGFQKALEILSDKKFSEDDMKKSFILGCEKRLTHPYHVEIETKPLLQQTEWDVEIVTKPYTEVGEGFNLESKREPKLDAYGCLILRRL